MKIKVYAMHQTAIIWYLNPPNVSSYYVKEINKNELKNGYYIQK
jgi:hypothetical protein